MVGFGLRHAAPGLLHELLRRGFVGAGRGNGRSAGFGRRQCLIVNLIGHFLFVDKQFVAVKIVLHFYIVGFRLFELSMSSRQLPLGGDHAGFGVFDIGGGELQIWLEVFTEVIGTVIFSDWAVASALARLACACATATS